jgi:hypothetical protein
MDTMDQGLLDFWDALNKFNVRYILVGGVAVRFHGFNRTTDDLDVWLEDTPTNRKNLRLAFFELGYGDFEEIETMQFIPGWTSFFAAGIEVDFMTQILGLENITFEECYNNAPIFEFNKELEVRFLHLNHLISAKQATNRSKDQLDLEYLTRIQNLKDQ